MTRTRPFADLAAAAEADPELRALMTRYRGIVADALAAAALASADGRAPVEPRSARRGEADDASSAQRLIDDSDGWWTLKRTLFPAESGRVRVQLELCRFGTATRWRIPWGLTARREGRILPAAQDRRGIWELEERLTRAEADALVYEVDLLGSTVV